MKQIDKKTSAPSKKWIVQAAAIGGVLLLVAVVLFLKNRTAEPPVVARTTPQATADEEDQGGAAIVPYDLPQARLDRLLAAGQPTLAFFHSNNCVQCTKMMRVVADVYPEFEDAVALVDVDVYDPQNRALLVQAQIHSIPTQIFYDAAGEEQLVVGAIPPQVFRAYMRSAAGEQ